MTKKERIPEILAVNDNWTATELNNMSAAEVESIHERVSSTGAELASESKLDILKKRMIELKEKDAAGMIEVGRELIGHAKGLL